MKAQLKLCGSKSRQTEAHGRILRLYTKTGNREGRFNPFSTLQPPPYAQGKRKSNSPHAKAKEKEKIKSAS